MQKLTKNSFKLYLTLDAVTKKCMFHSLKSLRVTELNF